MSAQRGKKEPVWSVALALCALSALGAIVAFAGRWVAPGDPAPSPDVALDAPSDERFAAPGLAIDRASVGRRDSVSGAPRRDESGQALAALPLTAGRPASAPAQQQAQAFAADPAPGSTPGSTLGSIQRGDADDADDADDAEDARDGARAQAQDPAGQALDHQALDPVNQRVLGPGQWMAQLEPQDEAALEDAIERSPAQAILAQQRLEAALSLAARSSAQRAARACLGAQPPAPHDGRRYLVLVVWAVAQPGQLARLMRPSVEAARGLDHPDYLGCVLDALGGQRVEVQADQPMELRLVIPLEP